MASEEDPMSMAAHEASPNDPNRSEPCGVGCKVEGSWPASCPQPPVPDTPLGVPENRFEPVGVGCDV